MVTRIEFSEQSKKDIHTYTTLWTLFCMVVFFLGFLIPSGYIIPTVTFFVWFFGLFVVFLIPCDYTEYVIQDDKKKKEDLDFIFVDDNGISSEEDTEAIGAETEEEEGEMLAW